MIDTKTGNIVKRPIAWEVYLLTTTYDCNLSCSYCLHKSPNSPIYKRNDFGKNIFKEDFMDNVLQFIDNTRSEQSIDVQVSGGEPTLYWDGFVMMTEKLKKISNARLFFVSNFSRELTDDQIDYMVENYYEIGFSIDGKKDVHEMNRGKNTYGHLMTNLEKIFSRAPKKPCINMVVNEDNAEYYFDSFKYVHALGLKNDLSIDFYAPRKNEEKFLSDMMEQFVMVADFTGDFDFIGFIDDSVPYCENKHTSVAIHPNGVVAHCSDLNSKEYEICNIKDPELKMNLEVFNNTQDSYQFYDHLCETCNANTFCRSGCYATFETGPNRDFFCKTMKSLADVREMFNRVRG